MRPAHDARYLEVDPKTKIVQNDGSDFHQVNPLGLVPTLRTDDGLVLTENAAILQYVADRFPKAGIAPGPASSAAGCINGCASSAPNCTRACSCRCWTRRRRLK